MKLINDFSPLNLKSSDFAYGISGDYIVTLGPDSNAEKGSDDSLPLLTASVGAFTRMWLGVLPASSLSIGDDLAGPQELIEKLDYLIRVPRPSPNWEY